MAQSSKRTGTLIQPIYKGLSESAGKGALTCLNHASATLEQA